MRYQKHQRTRNKTHSALQRNKISLYKLLEKSQMKTALQVVVIVSFFFTVGRLVAEQLPPKSATSSSTVEQVVTVEMPNISQKDKSFSVDQLSVKVGDTVKFTNDDPFFHNVFSLSPTSTFDLGSYPQGCLLYTSPSPRD